MIVKYYNNKELAYTNRKRYNKFSFTPFNQEEQKSILLGDGAITTIKTKKSNICNYVTIDDTRWYVTSYIYLNGGQVQLNLQRDVVGEFGIDNCFGKIERGYTDNFLKYRKELGLNQILKDRKKLIPQINSYGNYSVDTHEKEMWGVMYFTKQTELNPTTGEPYKDQININIPGFSLKTVDYDFIPNGSFKTTDLSYDIRIEFPVGISAGGTDWHIFYLSIKFIYLDGWTYNITSTYKGLKCSLTYLHFFSSDGTSFSLNQAREIADAIADVVATGIIRNSNSANGFKFPVFENYEKNPNNYDGVVVKKDDVLYSYSTKEEKIDTYLNTGIEAESFYNEQIRPYLDNFTYNGEVINDFCTYHGDYYLYTACRVTYTKIKYNYSIIENKDAGYFTLDVSQQLIDEPFIVLVTPLYDVNINGNNGEKYSINKKSAFSVFNTIIQYLSGTNGYLVDAQIYPYCPVLTSVSTEVAGIPFFSINSTCYEHNCIVQLLPSSDVKKEYIQRSYSIVSPEQTGSFSFNFYDYTNEVIDVNGVNYASIEVVIKTALKPFAIISSAVIKPREDSLIGKTYLSDLRGAKPSGNGFQCSLSSNAFQDYKRNNSNYQQIFSLQQEELQKQHEVERMNGKVSAVVNTISATSMGALAGSAMADVQAFGIKVSGAAGAITGGAVAGAGVGVAMALQEKANNDLRDYEQYLQQQRFDLEIGTIKNLPNSVNRISSFNEIIMKDFWFCVEIYECSEEEKRIVDNFIYNYGYGIGVFDYLINYQKDGWFLRSTLVSSSYPVNLHLIAEKEFMGGIYIYEQI